MRYPILFSLALIGCAPAKPAGCPVPPPSQDVEQAQKRLKAALASLDKLDETSLSLLDLISPGAREEYKQRMHEAREKALRMQRQIRKPDDK